MLLIYDVKKYKLPHNVRLVLPNGQKYHGRFKSRRLGFVLFFFRFVCFTAKSVCWTPLVYCKNDDVIQTLNSSNSNESFPSINTFWSSFHLFQSYCCIGIRLKVSLCNKHIPKLSLSFSPTGKSLYIVFCFSLPSVCTKSSKGTSVFSQKRCSYNTFYRRLHPVV